MGIFALWKFKVLVDKYSFDIVNYKIEASMSEELIYAFNSLTLEKKKEVEHFIYFLANETVDTQQTFLHNKKISIEELESFCTVTSSVPENIDAQKYISQLREDRVL